MHIFSVFCCLAPAIVGSHGTHAIGKFVRLSHISRYLWFALNAFYFNSWSALLLCFAVLSSGFYRKLLARARFDWQIMTSMSGRSLFYIIYSSASLIVIIVEIAAVHMRRVAADYDLYG